MAEYGEDIAYGKGWGLNDYEDEEKVRLKYAKMPILDHPYSVRKLLITKQKKRIVLDPPCTHEAGYHETFKALNSSGVPPPLFSPKAKNFFCYFFFKDIFFFY